MNLYFTKHDVEKIKNIKDTRLKEFVGNVLKQAEKALEVRALSEDEVSCDDGRSGNIHENYYDASVPFHNNMLLLAFAYFYTENEAYFEKARELMLMYAGYKKWYGKGYHGKSELNTAHFCVGMAYGYNYFKDKLTSEERKKIVDGTYKLGILTTMQDWVLPGTKIHAIDTMGHNWWIVCVSSAALAAMIMEEEIPNGKELVKAAADGTKQWFCYKGNPINSKPVSSDNGGYYESVSYADYSYKEYLNFRCAYREKYGKPPFDDMQILKDAADYFVKTSYLAEEGRYIMPFGDASIKDKPQAAFYLLFEGVDSKALRWYLQSCEHREIDLMDLVEYTEIWEKEALVPNEKSVFYEKIGWAVWRDSYEKNSVMFAVKCGDTWNHAHADAGHFVLFKNGKQIIYDSGTCNYGNPLYVPYYQSSYAHNVVLFNGKGQDIRDFMNHARNTGKMYNFVDQEGFKYVAADVTGPMGRYYRKHLRHFLWMDDFILIYDDIECYEKGELSFLLHADEDCGFKMLTHHIEDEAEGHLNFEPDKSTKVKVFKAGTDEECRAKFVSVISLGNDVVELEEIKDGYKITYGVTKVYINLLSDGSIMHRNCINIIDGYMTDAVIFTEKNDQYGVVNGSIIRKGEKVILDTLTRTTGLV